MTVPASVLVECPQCKAETLHEVLSGKMGGKSVSVLDSTVKCRDCGHVHHVTVKTAKPVEVPVVVTDRDGRFVPDLTKADFEVTERGVPQAITVFDRVSIPIAPRPPVTRYVASGDIAGRPSPASPGRITILPTCRACAMKRSASCASSRPKALTGSGRRLPSARPASRSSNSGLSKA